MEAEDAFIDFKNKLCNATLLSYPVENAKIILTVDASDKAIGGALHQYVNNQLQLLGFFSKKLTSTECNYSTYDRELLAIFRSIKYFKFMLEGRPFIVFTDHKPLCFAFKQKSDKASPRQLRQLDFISQFTTNIQHVKGIENVVPDFLSRIESINCGVIDYELISTQQESDDETQCIAKGESSTSLNLKKVQIPNSDKQLFCDVSDNIIRPYVPSQSKKHIFHSIHNLSHSGVRATKKLITSRFIWFGMNADITLWCKQCIVCQRSKIHRHNKTEFQHFSVPESRFEHVNIDIVGPFNSSDGNRYLLTCIDRFSRWPEIIPIPDRKAETVAFGLICGWFSRFGLPFKITTDRGGEFQSDLFRQLNNMLGVNHFRTTSYHPQANGLIERFHRTLKTALKCKQNFNWSHELPLILLGLRSPYKPDIDATPAEMVYGKPLRLPSEFFIESSPSTNEHEFIKHFRQTMSKLRPVPTSFHGNNNKFFIQKQLNDSTHVFVRDDRIRGSLERPYIGPFKVLKRNNKYFKIDINGKPDNVSIDRLKAAFLDSNDPLNSIFTGSKSNTFNEQSTQNQQINNNNNNINYTTRSGRKVKFRM